MRIQKFSNIRQQNFGDVIVLQHGIAVTQQDLDSMVKDSPYAKQWAEIEGKDSLVICSGVEQEELERLQAEPLRIGENLLDKIVRISKRAGELAKGIKPKIINCVEDLRGIDGFKALDAVTHVLAKVRAAAR